MKGIIIAGGAGTRLRPLTYTRPKPLIPVVNRPFLEYQVSLLKDHGITEIIFCTNYQAEKIENHFGNGEKFGVHMRYAIEKEPLGTGGAIKNAQTYAGRDTFVVLNGDILTDFDIGAILRFHKENEALVTLTLAQVGSPSPYGVIITETPGRGRVREFREPSEAQKKALAANPNVPKTGTDYINAGIYVMQPEALDRIPTGRAVSIERETFQTLLKEDARVFGISQSGYWLDIGRPAQYREATEAILRREITVAVPGVWQEAGYWAEEGVEIDPTAHLSPTVHVGRGAKIGEGASINGSTVIGPNCRIEENATITDCILEAGVFVGAGAKIANLILDDGVRMEADVVVNVPSVLAAGSQIGKGTRITQEEA